MSKYDIGLLKLCTTDRQREILTVLCETGSPTDTGRVLGMKKQPVQTLYKALLARSKEGIYDPATRTRDTPAQSVIVSKPIKAKRRAKYVITCAQNATPVFSAGLKTLRSYCKLEKAELIVVPIRYHNATSTWTQKDEDSNWWASEVAGDLVDKRTELCTNLVLLADIRIQPTAVRPTSGMETFCGGQSTILAHPKLETVTIPTPQNALAKLITTTGAITVDNYTDSKAGKKGEHHHTFGALVVEVNGDSFFIRQINMNEDGSFHDLSSLYCGNKVKRNVRAAGLVLGDLHERFADPAVVKATFSAKDSIINVLRPEAVVFHDVMDFHSANHHHAKKVFTKIAKHRDNRSSVEDEVNECARFIEKHTRDDQRVIFAPSNHPDALARWVEDADWKYDPENAEFYLKTALVMAQSARMSESGASYLDPFVYWMRDKLACVDRCEFPVRDESVPIAGIECGMHGDKGPNGARGNIRGFGRIGVKSVIGHSHTPGTVDGVYQVGTSSRLKLEYSGGPSSWMHAHCVIYPDGKRSLIFIINGKWRY